MKRITAVVVILSVLFVFAAATAETTTNNTLQVGTSFYFGFYEQDNNQLNGEEPIEWIVMETDSNKALLLSKHVLDFQEYHSDSSDIHWEGSAIRAWLNQDFYNRAFNASEQSAILTVAVSNVLEEGFGEWETAGGNDTQDQIFLLSYSNAVKYFGEQKDRKNVGTEYAKSLGAKIWPFEETDWWLRSPGKAQKDAGFIGRDGSLQTGGVTNKKGIRPALWLDLTVPQSGFSYNLFGAASALFNNQQFEEAALAFEALGTYQNSTERVNESKYEQAKLMDLSGDYETAITMFTHLGDYSDSPEMLRESRYKQAVVTQESGNCEKAIDLFSKLGQYKDSMTRLKECFKSQGISIYYSSDAAVNAGTDTGYSQSNKIDGKDSHFGWRLGRFIMSGFTRATESSNSEPIFIKTLGDKITLWFDLEQDIEQLNGSDNLSISVDNNGYDEYFGVQKTDFGRGTLIIRHKDYQNSLGEPVLYTNYLAAKKGFGADTKVDLFEEGDYEVSLNYETVSSSYGVLNNYSNYRIRFTFAIRNGNCMVYPFDVVTGTELMNSTFTENGFYLDLAKSRYLDINVKRTVLVEGAAGLTEDQRFNRPAKDGDQYTQEGIYTISVRNRYTGEETEKQLFVGTDALLKEYISNGFKMETP